MGFCAKQQSHLTKVYSLETPDYIQVTGVGDLTKIDIKDGDSGGELDPHGGELSPDARTAFH